jgi:Uncharacterized conserved protein
MYLRTIYINRFGGLKDFTLELSDNVNIIEGNNESGKTTICSFIRFIFYGFKDKRERTFHITWNSDAVSGYIIIDHDNHTYRIERECTTGGIDTVRIIDTAVNSTVFSDKSPADVFLGVPVDVYDRTIFVKQADNGHIDGRGIGEAIENLIYSADETVDTDKAMKRLDEARTMLLHKNEKGGRIYELEAESDSLNTRLINAIESNQDVIITETHLSRIKQLYSDNAERQAEISEAIKYYDTVTLARKYRDFTVVADNVTMLENDISELESNYMNGTDFLPDYEYIEDIKACEREIAEYNDAIEKTDAELEKANKPSSEQIEFTETLERHGGQANLIEKLDNYLLRRRMMVIFGSLCGLLCALAVVGALWIILTADIRGAFVFIAALIFLIISAICFTNSSRQKIMCGLIFDDFNVKNEFELDTYIEKMLDSTQNNPTKDELIFLLRKNHAHISLQLESKTSELNEYLQIWNKTNVSEAVTDAEKYLVVVRDKKHELDKALNQYNSMVELFEDSDDSLTEEELKAVEITDVSDIDIKALRREYEAIYQSNETLKNKIHETEKQLIALQAETESPSALADELALINEKIKQLRQSHDAYRLAYEKLNEASVGLKETAAPKLTAYASELINKFTSGKYDVLGVSHDLKMEYTTGDKTRGSMYMSAGTLDIAYLSLRFALIRLLYREIEPPLLLDESFARIDDGRLSNVLNLLREVNTQILLFTSQKRDAVLMTGNFNHIILGENK